MIFDKAKYLERVDFVADALGKEIKEIDRKHNSDADGAAVYFQGAHGLSHDFIKHIKRY